ncbi:MAG: response regulator, partial [Eubacterium sp.]|nr:response regulator [Eubacterium sp.]
MMKINLKTGKTRIFILLAAFIAVLALVGILMQSKLQTLLNDYVEKQVTEQAKIMAELVGEDMDSELTDLENIAWYIESETADIETLLHMAEKEGEGIVWGVLELGGNAVYGEPLAIADFSGIQNSFRGKRAVSYKEGTGLLFTVPVYHSGNVKYVLYKLVSEELLKSKFGMTCYDEQGRILLATGDEQIVVPFMDWKEADAEFLGKETVQDAFGIISEKMNISTAATILYKENDNSQYLFVAEVEDIDLLLVGTVAESVAAEGLFYVLYLIVWVFGLLLLLLAIGMAFLFVAEEKARESDELRHAKMLADSANQAKTDFLANMSHEIRTPINAVMGMNEMILRECEDESIREYAVNIQSAGKTLLSLINDILDLSKIEAGKMELVENEYHLSAVLNNVVNMVQVKAKQKNLDFEVEVDETIPDELFGDEVRIRQIIVNILNNAVKYTREGSVLLKVDKEVTAEKEILLKIAVKDTGIGIKEEDKTKLFQKFQRLDEKQNRNVEGTGLGLALTAKMVSLMQGRLEVDSVYGEGSTFTIFLPQLVMGHESIGDFEEKYHAYIQSTNIYKESFTAPEAKILVVDDNEMNLMVVENLLKKTKVQIVTCTSGEKCLELAMQNKFDVVFLDHLMPGMDGIETLKHLKKMENNLSATAAVIALTANAIMGVREMYLKEGFTDYLSKPIVGEELEEALRKYIPREKLVYTDVAVAKADVVKQSKIQKAQEAVEKEKQENCQEKVTEEASQKEKRIKPIAFLEQKLPGVYHLINVMFAEELPIQYKLLNLILSAVFVGGIFSLIASISLGIKLVSVLVTAAVIAIVALTLWITNKRKQPKFAALLIVIVVNVILFPTMYFTGGGIMSGMPVWMVLGMIFSWLILTGKTCFIMYVLNAFIVVGCMFLEMQYPDIVHQLESRGAVFGDAIQSIIIVTCIFGAIFKYQTYVYEKQKKQLLKANQAKGEFLANMSHEIRTPINAILGFNEMIMKESRESHTAEYALNVHTAGKALLKLVDELLNFTSEEKVEYELQKKFDLAENAPEEEFTAPGARLLLVDDNQMNLDLLKGILRNTKMKLDFAMNGQEALELVRKNRYHLILMDHMMPVMDGVEALQNIRSEHLCDDISIIVLTANVVENAKDEYLAAGFDDYLSKPIFRKQLIDTLKKYLPENICEEEAEEDTVEGEIIAEENFIDRLSFLDTATGMEYCCNDENFYREMLTSYLATNKYGEIIQFYQEENWDRYKILVHALKSTSLSIGATRLSEAAKQLEMAAKEDRIDYIRENHESTMADYRKLLDLLKGVLENKKDIKEEITENIVEQEKAHILVVDDDSLNLKIAEKLLGDTYFVEGVKSGQEALEFLAKNTVELVLLDVHMPEMNGFEVIRKMKA